MRRFLVLVVCAVWGLLLAVSALAVPDAEVSMVISDAVREKDNIVFTVSISADSPTETYASLDFKLVSSDGEKLSVVEKASESGDLDIYFTPDYGGAYHKGRTGGSGSELSYLIGIYAQTGGNVISDATDICSVRMRLTGEETQTLSIEDMKLIYKNTDGEIVGEPISMELPTLYIDDGITHAPIPGSGAAGRLSESDNTAMHPALYMLIGVVLAAVIAILVTRVKKKKPSKD